MPHLLHELREYVGLGAQQVATLQAVGPLVRPRFPAIVDRFYDAIEHSSARFVFRDPAQVDRLKGRLLVWLEELFTGDYGRDYLEHRSNIGRVHVRVGLDLRYMPAAMAVIRRSLHEFFRESSSTAGWDERSRAAGHEAIDMICDVDLALMLETYREDQHVQVRDAARLRTMEQVAGAIAHELRNPLAVIESSRQLVERATEDRRIRHHLTKIKRQVRYSAAILEALAALTRDDPVRPRIVVLDNLLDGVIESLPVVDGVEVTIERGEIHAVRTDPRLVQQILTAVMTNAIQACAPEGGRVHVQASIDGDRLNIVVADDGRGLSTETARRMFEPLFSTRTVGIGLGLPVARRLAERLGGTLMGRNRVGRGAEFCLAIPGGILDPDGREP